VVETRRHELAERLALDADQLRVPIDAAVDQLAGPLYHRALLTGGPIDDTLVESVVLGVLR
jgi:hypothetical protein